MPHDTTPAQLEALLNGLLRQEASEKLPYAFYIDDRPLLEELGSHLHTHKVWLVASLSVERIKKDTAKLSFWCRTPKPCS